MDLFKPRGATTIRRPTDDNQMNGQIYNPRRFAALGGLSSPAKFGGKNKMNIKPVADGKRVI